MLARATPDRRTVLLPLVFFISPLATSVAPRLTPFFVAILGISLIVAAMRRGMAWRGFLTRSTALTACLAFAAYVLINATWSADPLAGVGKGALLVALILMTFAAVQAAAAIDETSLRRAAIAFAAGALLGTVYILLELFTGGILIRTVMGWIPNLASLKHFKKHDGIVTAINLSKLDQNANLALFHLWPGLLALLGLTSTRRWVAIAIFTMLIVIVISLSEHDSSQVALIGSGLVATLAWRWSALVIRALAILWCAAFVLVIPASFAAYGNGLHFAEWLPKSARARVILWEFTAEQVLNRPLLGVGVDSTRQLQPTGKNATIAPDKPKGFVVARTLGHHAHSIFLQTWYELGAAGALLLAIAGAAVVLRALRLPEAAQPFAAASFAAFAIVGAFAWGMWQSWFMCALGLVALYLRVATAAIEQPPRRVGA